MSDLDGVFESEQNYMAAAGNYNRWIADQFTPWVKPGGTLLEVGCGMGNKFELLSGQTRQVGVDIATNLIELARERFKNRPEIEVHCVDMFAPGASVPFAGETFDSIVSDNVLEHIEDDAGALRLLKDYLKPGGRLSLYVPAGKWIYGKLDVQTGHHRRYNKRELRGKLEAAGYTVDTLYYVNLPGYFGWGLSHFFTKHVGEMGGQARVFNALVPLFRLYEDRFPVPFGQSVFASAHVD